MNARVWGWHAMLIALDAWLECMWVLKNMLEDPLRGLRFGTQ